MGPRCRQTTTMYALSKRRESNLTQGVGDAQGDPRAPEARGPHLKDVRLALVVFPAEREGEMVYRGWRSGEPAVAFWHRIEDGCAGRRPLRGPPRPRYLQ